MRQSVADAASDAWTAKKTLAWREFAEFLDELEIDDPNLSNDEHVLLYLQSKFESSEPLSYSTLESRASAIVNARRDHGLPDLSPQAIAQKARLLKSFKKHRPVGRAQTVPLQVHDLVQHVPRGDSFAELLRRTLFGIRAVTMMRPAAPTTIRLSTIARTKVGNKDIVVFHFRSKAASAQGVATDTNYVEFINHSSPNRWICPATNLLRLVERIKLRAQQLGKPVPESICVDEQLRPLDGDAVSRMVKDIMTDAGWRESLSKDLRRLSQQNLRLWRSPNMEAIESDDIYLRGGWATTVGSAVVHRHYSDFRLVAANFADILLG